jgi:addiction module HigA family antidote
MAQRRKLSPIHPGELLRDELDEIGVSLNELGRALRVPMNRISAIVNGKRAITVDTAMRLARYFGTSPQYWLNLQVAYDLEVAGREIQPRIEKEVLPRAPPPDRTIKPVGRAT